MLQGHCTQVIVASRALVNVNYTAAAAQLCSVVLDTLNSSDFRLRRNVRYDDIDLL